MKLWFEKLYPYILGCLASILWYELKLKLPNEMSLISSTLTLSGVLLGFMATSKSILISSNISIIEQLKETNYIKELISYIGQAIWLNLIFCTCNVIGFFVENKNNIYGMFWIFIAISSLFAFIRVTDIMLKILKHNN